MSMQKAESYNITIFIQNMIQLHSSRLVRGMLTNLLWAIELKIEIFGELTNMKSVIRFRTWESDWKKCASPSFLKNFILWIFGKILILPLWGQTISVIYQKGSLVQQSFWLYVLLPILVFRFHICISWKNTGIITFNQNNEFE